MLIEVIYYTGITVTTYATEREHSIWNCLQRTEELLDTGDNSSSCTCGHDGGNRTRRIGAEEFQDGQGRK